MRKKTLILCRGITGSGKTTLAEMLAPNGEFYAADDYWEEKGIGYDSRLSGEAHQNCQDNVAEAMKREEDVIVVHNTMSQLYEAQPFFDLAHGYSYSVFVIECQNDFGTTHAVPEGYNEKLKARWEPLR